MPAVGGSMAAGSTPDTLLTDDNSDSSGFDWSGVINNMVSAAAQVVQKVSAPPPFITTPSGAIVNTSTGATYGGGLQLSGTALLLIVGGVAFLVFMRK